MSLKKNPAHGRGNRQGIFETDGSAAISSSSLENDCAKVKRFLLRKRLSDVKIGEKATERMGLRGIG